MITWDDVVAIAPELASIGENAQTIILEWVNQALKPSEWDGEGSPKIRLARILLAAHFGSLPRQGADGEAGPVVSEAAGGLSRSYGLMPGADPTMDTTLYGRQFRTLLATSPARAGRVL